jgi:hypothetical protein
VYPDREYCILSLPHASNDTALLSKFSLATPAVGSTFEHVLYVLNRSTLLCPSELVVRRATVWDKPAIISLVSSSPSGPHTLKAITDALPYSGMWPHAFPTPVLVALAFSLLLYLQFQLILLCCCLLLLVQSR